MTSAEASRGLKSYVTRARLKQSLMPSVCGGKMNLFKQSRGQKDAVPKEIISTCSDRLQGGGRYPDEALQQPQRHPAHYVSVTHVAAR